MGDFSIQNVADEKDQTERWWGCGGAMSRYCWESTAGGWVQDDLSVKDVSLDLSCLSVQGQQNYCLAESLDVVDLNMEVLETSGKANFLTVRVTQLALFYDKIFEHKTPVGNYHALW
jgi:hypothetical protein